MIQEYWCELRCYYSDEGNEIWEAVHHPAKDKNDGKPFVVFSGPSKNDVCKQIRESKKP